MLKLFDLYEWKNHLIESYSHGMRQKLIMASVFMLETPMIIVDEPMVGLDPKSARIVKELFKRHSLNGGAVFLSTHSLEIAEELLNDATAIEEAGCFSIVLEGIPSVVADVISQSVKIPTIGIGAGINVDGQVLVSHDLLGMKSKEYIDAKFVKRYTNQYQTTINALKKYKKDIESKKFPTEEHSYKAGEDIEKRLKSWKKDLNKIKLS